MIFVSRRRLRIAKEEANSWRDNCMRARAQETWYKAKLFDSWNVIRAQQKGLNRQRRLIRRLQEQVKVYTTAIHGLDTEENVDVKIG